MTIIQAIILGVIQGLTEFIPVSSTAHLLLAQSWLGWKFPEVQAFSFDILVQLGTLLALIVFFWREWVTIITAMLRELARRQPFADPQARLGWLIVLATIPALVAGVLFKDAVEALFSDPSIAAGIRLLVTALLLALAEIYGRGTRRLESIGWLDALVIGLAQVLSVFPGASRSGSTITGGMARQLDRSSAARFAFLMSAPVMLAAGAYQSLDLLKTSGLGSFLLPLAAGFIAAAIVGFFAIRWLLQYLANHRLYVFALYCLILGLAAILLKVTGILG